MKKEMGGASVFVCNRKLCSLLYENAPRNAHSRGAEMLFRKRVPVGVPGRIKETKVFQGIKFIDDAGGIPADIHGKFREMFHIDFFPQQISGFRQIVFPFQNFQKFPGKMHGRNRHVRAIYQESWAADHNICDFSALIGLSDSIPRWGRPHRGRNSRRGTDRGRTHSR